MIIDPDVLIVGFVELILLIHDLPLGAGDLMFSPILTCYLGPLHFSDLVEFVIKVFLFETNWGSHYRGSLCREASFILAHKM